MPVLLDGNIPQPPEVFPKLELLLLAYGIILLSSVIFIRLPQNFGSLKIPGIVPSPAHMKTRAAISSSRLGEASWLAGDSPSLAGTSGST
jgi:hypothetical protein